MTRSPFDMARFLAETSANPSRDPHSPTPCYRWIDGAVYLVLGGMDGGPEQCIPSPLSKHLHGYLTPQAEAFYPTDPAEFRALYQVPSPLAPEYRLEGLASMDDPAIALLAQTLQMASVLNLAKVDECWAAVCEQGRQVAECGL